jgi:hypothetical protein
MVDTSDQIQSDNIIEQKEREFIDEILIKYDPNNSGKGSKRLRTLVTFFI